jgi:hypothetical protein
MAQTVKQKQQAKKSKLTKTTKKNADKQRANDVIDLKLAYGNKQAAPAIKDFMEKIKKFQGYHIKIAQDGVGAKKTGYKLENGQEEVENVYLTSEQRAGHLDKAAGLQEIFDYVERMLTPVTDELAKKAS